MCLRLDGRIPIAQVPLGDGLLSVKPQVLSKESAVSVQYIPDPASRPPRESKAEAFELGTPPSAELDEGVRAAIRRTLAAPLNGSTDARAVAETALVLWQKVTAALEPVIGSRGVEALFNRALQLTSTSFPWLSAARPQADAERALTSIQECLATRDAAMALEASITLMVTLSDLLATLVGTSLTRRLLGPVWARPNPPIILEVGP